MPFYASVEQVMRDRSELARKGIARGRGVVAMSYGDGVLFVAENLSSTLHKISEIYDRIGFAAVGRYNEYENLRTAGIRLADVRGYAYDRRDVTGRVLANAYAQTLGAIFSEQQKPYEVEICVAEVGLTPERDQLYHLTYDGSIGDEPDFVVMGGQADAISTAMREGYQAGLGLEEAIAVAIRALGSASGSNGSSTGRRTLGMDQLEVAVLERSRPKRAFRRISGTALASLLPRETSGDDTRGDGPDAHAKDGGAGAESPTSGSNGGSSANGPGPEDDGSSGGTSGGSSGQR